MTPLLRRVHLLTEAWNRACPEHAVPVEWVEEYVHAELWLQACDRCVTTPGEPVVALLRLMEFNRLLRNASPLLRDLEELVARSS